MVWSCLSSIRRGLGALVGAAPLIAALAATTASSGCGDVGGDAGSGGGAAGGGGGAAGSGGAAAASPAGVSGSVHVSLGSKQVAIPDVEIQLREPGTANPVGPAVKTNLIGEFSIPKQPVGTYDVCWSAPGFAPGCSPALVSLSGEPVRARGIEITPLAGSVAGRALLADGKTPCRYFDIFFGLDVWTDVELVDAATNQVLSKVRANSFGDFVFGGLPSQKGLLVHATCEASTSSVAVGKDTWVDVSLPNHRPTITGTFAYEGGKGVRRAAAGSVVDVVANVADVDGDPIHYLWRVIEGSGVVTGGDAPAVMWGLPEERGFHTLYVIAYDGKGGYAFDRAKIKVTSGDQLLFSGRFFDWEGGPLAAVKVEVGDGVTTTDDSGYFSLHLEPSGADRHVMRAKKEGYAMFSKVFDSEVSGGRYRMIAAQTSTVDPKADIVLTDQMSYLVAKKGVQPISLTIPANTLVDAAGKPATSPLILDMATLDPALTPIPGDFQALDKQGNEVSLLSYGVLHVEIRDGNGAVYNLAPGATAEVTFPKAPPGAPPVVPVWYYDEQKGLWVEYAQATPTGQGYVAAVPHFSEINLDLVAGAAATCARVRPDSTIVPGSTLHVTTWGQTFQLVLDGAPVHGLFRLPVDDVLSLEVTDPQGNPISAAAKTVALDLPTYGNRPELSYPFPYEDCAEIGIGIQVPAYGILNQGNSPFLTKEGPYNTPLGVPGALLGMVYYDAVDPLSERATLGAFWAQNGFDQTGNAPDAERASYFNANDLGVGRDMRCRQTGPDTLACFVTNYDSADLALAAEQNGAIVTVAMERSVVSGTGPGTGVPIVKFFAYGGGSATAVRLREVDLDGHGPKPVPYVCVVCHGQSYHPPLWPALPTAADVDTGARFREFDLPSFSYTGERTYADVLADKNGSIPQAAAANALLDSMQALNEMVRDHTGLPATHGIVELVNAWYPGGGDNEPDVAFVPSGWQGAGAPLYTDVFSVSCRTCHIAQDSLKDFVTYGEFAGLSEMAIPYNTCGETRLMPNAQRTYNNFWTSNNPHQPGVLATFNGPGWMQIGACP